MGSKNLAIVRQSFANTTFTHKVQEVAAEFQEEKARMVRIGNILVVAIVLFILILQATNSSNPIFSYIGAGVTAGEIIFLIIQLTFSYEQRVLSHKNSALKYLGLRDNYRALITDIMNSSLIPDAVTTRRDLLQREYQIISDLSPQTGQAEYREAQKRLNKQGIVEGEDFTWSDAEIDRFLPEELRLKS